MILLRKFFAHGSEFEQETIAYMSAIGIGNDTTIYYSGTAYERTGAQIYGYVNKFVKYLKDNSLYSKMYAVYPFIGGTATSHKYNLINPLDTNAAYRLTFTGGLTHSATGILPNGSTGYANTYLNASTAFPTGAAHASYYSRTSSTVGGTHNLGAYSASGFFQFNASRTSQNGNCVINTDVAGVIYFQNLTDTKAWLGMSRTGSGGAIYVNGTQNNTGTSGSFGVPNLPVFLFCRNSGSVPNLFTDQESACITIGAGLTSSEMSLLYTGIHQLQTDLGRNN